MASLTPEQIESSIRMCETKLRANEKWRSDNVYQIKPTSTKPVAPVEKFLSVQEVSHILGYCTHTIRAWAKSKRILGYKFGPGRSQWRFRELDILELAPKGKHDV